MKLALIVHEIVRYQGRQLDPTYPERSLPISADGALTLRNGGTENSTL